MIAWIMALDSELRALTDNLENVRTREIADLTFYLGEINKEQAIAVKCGVGKVAAAMTAAITCLEFRPDALINLGVAGGIKPGQEIGDWVFSTEAIQADFDTSPVDGPEGFSMVFKADEALLEKALRISALMDYTEWSGQIITQDIFLSRQQDYDRLLEKFPDGLAAEMEGGAVAQVAERFNIPFLIIRKLSDLTFENGNENQYLESGKRMAAQTAEFVKMWYFKDLS